MSLLGRFGRFAENSGKHVHPPRQVRPSIRGLFDLHGNLFEWTHDWYEEYVSLATTDPLVNKGGSDRVLRGGGWIDDAAGWRSAFRFTNVPSGRTLNCSFRLALSPSGVSPEAGKSAEPSGGGGSVCAAATHRDRPGEATNAQRLEATASIPAPR